MTSLPHPYHHMENVWWSKILRAHVVRASLSSLLLTGSSLLHFSGKVERTFSRVLWVVRGRINWAAAGGRAMGGRHFPLASLPQGKQGGTWPVIPLSYYHGPLTCALAIRSDCAVQNKCRDHFLECCSTLWGGSVPSSARSIKELRLSGGFSPSAMLPLNR